MPVANGSVGFLKSLILANTEVRTKRPGLASLQQIAHGDLGKDHGRKVIGLSYDNFEMQSFDLDERVLDG